MHVPHLLRGDNPEHAAALAPGFAAARRERLKTQAAGVILTTGGLINWRINSA